MFRFALLPCLPVSLFLLASCEQASPADEAAQDARDIAYVEAVQAMKPPLEPVHPSSMSPNVRQVFGLGEAGCDFRASPGKAADPVLVAGGNRAILRIADKPAFFAADAGSAELPGGMRTVYVGRAHSARLTRTPDTLTIRDRFERIVYRAAGTLTCRG